MSALPLEEHFPTGHAGETLVLLACAGFLWAGRYSQSTARTPAEIAVTTARRVTARQRAIHVGRTRFALNPRSLQRACRWLSRQGITVRELQS